MVNAPKLKALVISLAAATMLAATPALADGGDRHNRHGGHGGHGHYQAHNNGHGHKYGHKKHGRKYQQAYKRGYRQGSRQNYRRGYQKPYYSYKRPYYRSYGGTSFSFTYAPAPRPVYVAPAPRPVYVAPAPRVVYSQPATTVITTPVRHGPATGGASSCLMTREYQTEIVVGNQIVPGYGNACLQPDGSWLRLPAKPVPQY